MDQGALKKLLDDLDRLAVEGEPRSQITIGFPPSSLFVTANQSGLMSLARTFLLAALTRSSSSDRHSRLTQIPESHVQVVESDSDSAIVWIEHSERVPIPKEVIAPFRKEARANGRLLTLGCGIVAVVILTLIVSGMIFWFAIFTGELR